MRLFRKHSRFRVLDERECYLRLHGRRSGDVEVLPLPRGSPAGVVRSPGEPRSRREQTAEGRRRASLGGSVLGEVPAAPRPPSGPTDTFPALHLIIAYPRSGARLTGEQIRRELLRRMRARSGEAA